MSGGLAPSKSTVYVSNLPFSLTNNDLHKILEKYGKVVKVTIVKDKTTRRSKGVAFVLFLEREAAHKSCHALHKTVMFGRTINCSIARDNGRTVEFIRRKEYTDKSKCYECGEEGHLSYKCPKNLLGERDQPKKKKVPTEKEHGEEGESSGEEDTGEDPKEDSLAAAIKFQAQQEKSEMDGTPVYSAGLLASYSGASFDDDEPKKKKYKKDAYFSDEEELGEEQGDDD